MRAKRRQSPRTDCSKTGSLFSRDSAVFWDCLVWDVSRSGVMVELDPALTVPQVSRLRLPAPDIHRKCRQVCQDGRKAGLQFVD